VTVIANIGDSSVALPEGRVLIASEAFEGRDLPADTAVWLVAD
jgi:alpha-glucosidase